MDSKRLDLLLDKYWNCLTTTVEEQELREYFCHGDGKEVQSETARLFRYFDHEGSLKLNENSLDPEMIKRKSQEKKTGFGARLFFIGKAAAIGLVLIVAAYSIRKEYINSKLEPYFAETFQDPKEAYEETKKALMMVSESFNLARKETQKLSAIDEAKNKIIEN